MAVSSVAQGTFCRLVRFGLTTPDASRLAAFYEQAFGFRHLLTERRSGNDFERLTGVEGGATSTSLGLGQEIVDLWEFDRPGQPYPNEAVSSDLVFQHFAIVTTDMRAAWQRLSEVGGWTAISRDGPQRLPDAAGGVTAFKFRDPDGHPFELLAFPAGKVPPHWHGRSVGCPCLGIDHSAISVSDSARSIAFYEGLGLKISARSLNRGPAQERLDNLCEPRVEVTALAPPRGHPHLELLCYRPTAPKPRLALQSNDVAATRLVFETCKPAPANEQPVAPHNLRDPDGHHLVVVAGNGETGESIVGAR